MPFDKMPPEKDEPEKQKDFLTQKDIDAAACAIIQGEKQRWEVATAFVTDRVSFKMRQLIRILRKNYYGIYEQPYDSFTGLEKVWYPLTFINTEAVIKNVDLDQKDINFISKTPNGYWMTDLTRAHVREKLSKMNFGDMLDDLIRMLCIDGTAVWKTYEEYGKCQIRLVDLLNIYLDPTTPSIQSAYRFTERNLMFPEEIEQMSGWRNRTGIKPVQGLPRIDPYWMNRATQVNSNVKMVDVYECWGKIPLALITGKQKDYGTEVEGHIVASGIDGGTQRCHLIELNTKQDREGNYIKPYEEVRYTKVPNRWYGMGIAERLLMLQIYANTMFNIRINRSRISQLGLFKVRKGSGVTPAMLARLPSNGVVVLNNMDDLAQLEIDDISASSYRDEDVINAISERLTNAFEVVTGEALPSSTPATNAAIQNQNAKSGFSLVKDAIGNFLERWMNNHALPILAKELKVDTIVRFESDDDQFKQLANRIVLYYASKSLDEHYERGYIPSPAELQREMDSAREKIVRSGIFVQLVEKIMAEELDTRVQVTNQEMDIPMTVQNLINMMNIAPEYRDDMVKQTFDLLGLQQPRQQPQQQPQQQTPNQLPPNAAALAAGAPSPIQQQIQQLSTGANVAGR